MRVKFRNILNTVKHSAEHYQLILHIIQYNWSTFEARNI